MEILQHLGAYAKLGWKLVLLNDAGERGKLPRFRDWGTRASSDIATVEGWARKHPNANWGLLLGPQSGVIDVEADGPDGERLLTELVGNVATPSYSSGRGTHRLFRWSDTMVDYPAAVTVEGIEFRLGGGKQSHGDTI